MYATPIISNYMIKRYGFTVLVIVKVLEQNQGQV